ncbi:S8 family peptidase [Pseudochrobactrum lubricantis]|uniref:S8 family peptidase n=1 Tax=Pseudochrobactrum lubricantis TaxID=558172 RepID=UPI0035D89BE9
MALYDHLALKRLDGTYERRVKGFGVTPDRNHKTHGNHIQTDIQTTLSKFEELSSIGDLDPSLIFKIAIEGVIPEDEWRKLDLIVLTEDTDNSVVLFANDKSLNEFKRKVEEYSGDLKPGQKNPSYNGLISSINSVSLIEKKDRIGPKLQADGYTSAQSFSPNTDYILDVELHKPTDDFDVVLFLNRLRLAIEAHSGQILSTYSGSSILLARVKCNTDAIAALLDLPEVLEVEAPPQPDLAFEDLSSIDLGELEVGQSPPLDAVTIGIIDSGVNFGHPLLAPIEACAITYDPTGSPSDSHGHGTSVASVAAFGDIATRVKLNNFNTSFRIASARVLDDEGHFPDDISLPALMENSITQLHKNYGTRIFNISLGDPKSIYTGGKNAPWTAALDNLARELDILIIVSSGNRKDLGTTLGETIVKEYPHYLAEPPSRLFQPATGANVLTVGSIAHSNGLEPDDFDFVDIMPICEKDEPSPFTRTGPGIREMIKPDLVDIGGNVIWSGLNNKLLGGSAKPSTGIWTFNHTPIGNDLFTSQIGTSFAAPQLAYKAAILLEQFPNASANLLRSLLALTAAKPEALQTRIANFDDDKLRMVCGHGVSNIAQALHTEDDRVIFWTEDDLSHGHFAIYEIPIPADFQITKGRKEIRVSLAFDPPVRHTRASYLGVTMGWHLLRGSTHSEVLDRFRKWKKEEGKLPEFEQKYICPTDINSTLREYGTLQVGTYTGHRKIDQYGDKYYVAVWNSARWNNLKETSQKYALCVQMRHQNLNTLYQILTTPIKVKV